MLGDPIKTGLIIVIWWLKTRFYMDKVKYVWIIMLIAFLDFFFFLDVNLV